MEKEEQGNQSILYFGNVSNLELFIVKYGEQFKLLTDREKEILTLVANGINNSAIGKNLGISQVEVQSHRFSIQTKLAINNKSGYIKYALAFGLISF